MRFSRVCGVARHGAGQRGVKRIHSLAAEGREEGSCSSHAVLRPGSVKGDVRFQRETLTIMINLFPNLTNTSQLVDATDLL